VREDLGSFEFALAIGGLAAASATKPVAGGFELCSSSTSATKPVTSGTDPGRGLCRMVASA